MNNYRRLLPLPRAPRRDPCFGCLVFHFQFANAEDAIDDHATGPEALSGFKPRRGSAGMKQ
jgi:hypothetical protein